MLWPMTVTYPDNIHLYWELSDKNQSKMVKRNSNIKGYCVMMFPSKNSHILGTPTPTTGIVYGTEKTTTRAYHIIYYSTGRL